MTFKIERARNIITSVLQNKGLKYEICISEWNSNAAIHV